MKEGLVLLVVPILVASGLLLMTRARRWQHIAAFLLGAALYAVIGAYLSINVFHQVDWKFREAPQTAFEIGLASAGITNLVAALALTAGLLFAERVFNSDTGRRHWLHSLLAGVLASPVGGLVVLVLGHAAPELSFWAGLVLPPIAYALVWFRKPGRVPQGSEQGVV